MVAMQTMGLQRQREIRVMMKQCNAMAVLGLMGGVTLSVLQAAQLKAQEPDITILSYGENFAIRYGEMHDQNKAGGRAVLSVTGGEGGGIIYASGEPQQRPMLPHLSGGGESQELTYSAPVPASSMVARAASAVTAEELAAAPDQRR
jgi:hypothetical protein